MLQPRVLVARENELARASAALDSISTVTGAAVVIEGPAGIGKSTLAQRLVDHVANGGARVRTGAARELEADLPFAAIADLLGLDSSSDDPDRAEVGALLRGEGDLDATQRRWRVLDAALDVVETEASEGPLVLVLEDLHWADSDSAATLARLAAMLERTRVGIVVTTRPEPRSESIAAALRALADAGATDVVLGALTASQVVELARTAVGADPDPALRDMLARAGGNPLYVLEVLEALQDEGVLAIDDGVARLDGDSLPPSLRLTIVRRLGYLPQPTVRVLRQAAVLGESAAIDRLAATLRRDPLDVLDQLEPAFRSGLLAHTGGSVTFRHALVRDALYDDLPEATRTALHGQVAEVLHDLRAPAGQVGVHLQRALGDGHVPTALRLLDVATELVETTPDQAASHARRVLDVLPPAHPGRLRGRTVLAQAAARTGDPRNAEVLVRDLDNAGLDDTTRLDLWRTVTVARHMRGEHSAEALDDYLAVVERAAIDGDDRWRHLALIAFADRWRQAERAHDLATTVLTEATDDRARTLALATLTVTGFLTGHARESTQAAAEAVEVAERAGLGTTWVGVEAHAAAGFISAVDPERQPAVREALVLAIERAERAGLLYALPRLHIELARGAAFQGDFDAAVAYAETALRAMDETGYGDQADSALGLLALIAVERGQHDLIEHYRSQVTEHATMTSRQEPWTSRARRSLRHGRPQDVWEGVRAAVDRLLGDHPHPFVESLWLLPYIEVAVAVGEPEVARELVDRYELLTAHAAPGLAVARTGRALLDRTVEAAEDAIGIARTTAVWPVRFDALRIGGEVLAENGRRDEAIVVLKEGRALADAAGATVVVAQYDALLRDLGVRRGAVGGGRRPDTGWEALTEAELRVVELVADGLTYREIGERLFVSRRTVETHVANARRKLGAANRNELTRAWLDR